MKGHIGNEGARV